MGERLGAAGAAAGLDEGAEGDVAGGTGRIVAGADNGRLANPCAMPSLNPATQRPWSLDDFDYTLPPELVAQAPLAQRSASRLLDGRGAQPVDRVFTDLPGLLQSGDLLVFNDTQVVKARLWGHKASGGRLEMLIERVLPAPRANEVVAHLRVSKKPVPGAVLQMDGGFSATLLGRWAPDAQGGHPSPDGELFHLRLSDDPFALMHAHGQVPLPPYIEREPHGGPQAQEDERRYQTVFARHPGAVAAPTAALHFDDGVLAALDARGVQRASVTLHVGAGTFMPVKTQDLSHHVMHAEWYDVPAATQSALRDCKARGGRVVAVGTTTVRTLESWAATGQPRGDTQLFITPGFAWAWVDLLVTNFHLPKSTLMMLVSALTGHRHIMDLYAHAVRERYRFFSYGDSMLLQRPTPSH